MEEKLIIKGAREHNLKDIDVEIPKNKLVVFTGVSGSGKSSLAFDTIYAEGQRRYVESLSSYARQFLGIMDKPDVDNIEGLSPAISIDQKSTSHNPRSTVGTITEIYDYLRLLFARIGHPHCPNCGREISHLSVDQIVEQISELASKRKRFLILAPLVKERKGEYSKLFDSLRAKGITKVRVDGKIYGLDDDLVLIKTNKHSIEAVVDRFTTDLSRLREGVEQALKLSEGEVIAAQVLDASLEFPEFPQKMTDHLFSEKFACPYCNISLSEVEPRLFSFNAPQGACSRCTGLGYLLKIDPDLVLSPELSILEGGILPLGSEVDHDTWFMREIKVVAQTYQINLTSPISQISREKLQPILYGSGDREIYVQGTNREGRMTGFNEKFEGVIPRLERLYRETASEWRRFEIEKYMRNEVCPQCHGTRLKPEALSITINGQNIDYVVNLGIKAAREWVKTVSENAVSRPILKELLARLTFLVDVGLDYLTLARMANSLAGGEAQRIRLASQIGSGLSGVLYVLDEPSIGLHQRDNKQLISTLTHLRDLGNSVIVVEHDREMMESADYIFDIGPGAGEHGGQIMAEGSPEEIKKNKNSLTGQYLSGKRTLKDVVLPWQDHVLGNMNKTLTLVGAREHNLKNITVEFPLGKFICVTGVSGSGKSTLVHDILYQALATEFYPQHKDKPGAHDGLVGVENLDKVILIDQSPIGRTPRSNPATYTGAFTFIRELFAATKEARMRGYKAGRFSFNVKGGRCEACEGEGQTKIEMNFLPDVYIPCEVCQGKRYNADALEVLYKDKNIAQVLDMTVEEANEFFEHIPHLKAKLETLLDVGLGYVKLGQPAPTLSGGEAQRVKLASELSKKATGKTFYILDEPTTGLHFADLERLLHVLKMLVAHGNTVVVIEHNLDVVKNADHIIDLGPEGGDGGGEIVAVGTPAQIAANNASWTGKYLRQALFKS
ncbi:MAG: excinuclease ABC subunit UvrA [Patescibacteria group bacterium]|nr:excinuclease ABC subunit UvrA [Patescibacteria group bacterium]MCL5431850.1 excinuclease ABC subunit UvrA [Patescibacteria group bacterium]